ncbi:MAG TPA: COX15/CtaA family protein [Candidatus Acidoferrum sp.]|nr:COX15/CtaA family protein [Candidatus Acidoferrum sp.]
MSGIYRFRAVHRFALATSACTVLLLMAGALVTSNDAADSVPDWPLAYGKIIPPLIGGIRYEFTHRVVAGLVAILTLVLAIWLARDDTRRWARRLGWTALALVVAQALLGALRVLEGHPAVTATSHAILAQLFFITVVSLSLFTSEWWQVDVPPMDDSGSPGLRRLAAWTTAVIFAQLILGAAFRHGAFGIAPHIVGAGVVTVMVVWTGRAAKKRFARIPAIRRSVIWLHATFGTQILLGGAAYWAILASRDAPQPGLTYVILSVAHVLVGALTLAASVLLTLICFRLVRPAESLAADSTVAHSQAGGR